MSKVADFKPASKNSNQHTARGIGALEKSIQHDGWIGAMTGQTPALVGDGQQ
jgi:hypothetical protein